MISTILVLVLVPGLAGAQTNFPVPGGTKFPLPGGTKYPSRFPTKFPTKFPTRTLPKLSAAAVATHDSGARDGCAQ